MSGLQPIIERQDQPAVYRLPPELLLNILDRLDFVEFPSVILALFPLLRRHGIAPPISDGEHRAMSTAARTYRCNIPGQLSHLASIPFELLLQTARHLTTVDKVNLTIAIWPNVTFYRLFFWFVNDDATGRQDSSDGESRWKVKWWRFNRRRVK